MLGKQQNQFFPSGHSIFTFFWSQDFLWKLQAVFSCCHASLQSEDTARDSEVLQHDCLEPVSGIESKFHQ